MFLLRFMWRQHFFNIILSELKTDTNFPLRVCLQSLWTYHLNKTFFWEIFDKSGRHLLQIIFAKRKKNSTSLFSWKNYCTRETIDSDSQGEMLKAYTEKPAWMHIVLFYTNFTKYYMYKVITEQLTEVMYQLGKFD